MFTVVWEKKKKMMMMSRKKVSEERGGKVKGKVSVCVLWCTGAASQPHQLTVCRYAKTKKSAVILYDCQ